MSRNQLARRGIIGLSGLWVLVIVVVFALRVTFPLELEWMEDGALQQAARIQAGEPIYGPPTAEYVPYLYTPVYPFLLAVLGYVFPLGFVLGRLVSIAAVAAVCAALWRLVGREQKPRAHQAVAVALFLSGYVFTYRWLDLARIDSTFLALTTWGLVFLREAEDDRRKVLLAGVLMSLAFWTKQTAFIFIVASGALGLLIAPRRLWLYVLTIGGLAGGGVLIGNGLTDGWLWTYIYELHQTHEFNEIRFKKKTWGMFLHAAPFLVVLLGMVGLDHLRAWLRARGTGKKGRDGIWSRLRKNRGRVYWGVLAAAGLLASALGYSTQWAETNNFIPGVCFGAAFIAVVLPKEGTRETLALGLVGAQLIFSLVIEPMYQPIQNHGPSAIADSYALQEAARNIPTGKQRKRAAELRERIETTNGEILALHRPWWGVMAAGTSHVSAMGINDVPDERGTEIKAALRERVANGDYAAIWLEGDPPAWLRREIARNYRVELRLRGPARVRPMSGYMSEAGMVTPYRGDQFLLIKPKPRSLPHGAIVIAAFEEGGLDDWELQGRAFGRRPVRSIHKRLPPIGPIGGEFLLSSAASSSGLKDVGEAHSPSFELPEGGAVEMLLGASGPRDVLKVELVDDANERRTAIKIPKGRWTMSTVRLDIPSDWAGSTVHLRLADEGAESAVFVDDLWIFGP